MFWKAPEQFQLGQPYPDPVKVDIWALGILVLWLYTGRQFGGLKLASDITALTCSCTDLWNGRIGPFTVGPDGRKVLRKVLADFGRQPFELPDAAADFVVRCLQRQPEDRPTAGALLRDPFLANGGWQRAAQW